MNTTDTQNTSTIFHTANPITGIVYVTGPHGTGKTDFAFSNGAHPRRMALFDDDVKTQVVVDMVRRDLGEDFRLYEPVRIVAAKYRELAMHEYLLAKIEQIERMKGELDCVIFDTWTRFGASLHAYVGKNRREFRDEWAPSGQIAGAQEWQSAREYEASLLARISAAVPLVILTSHIKDESVDGPGNKRVKTGRQLVDVSPAVLRVSRLRLWLTFNPASLEPIGLVLKGIEKLSLTPQGMKPIGVLPPKLNPCTWDTILSYWHNPIGSRAFLPHEIPSEFERSIIDGTLTRDQREQFVAMAKLVAASGPDAVDVVEAELPAPLDPVKAKELFDKHGLKTGREALATELGREITPAEFSRALQNGA